MKDLIKEMNLAIGALRAHREYFGEGTKLLVDNSTPGFPTIMQKSRLLEALHNAEVALDKAVCELSGYTWNEKNECRDGCKIKKALQDMNDNTTTDF